MLVVFSLALGFFTYWLSPVSNYFSRKHEFEADHFAREAVGSPEPLISALRKLYVENLSHPLPHPLMTTFHYSHPTLLEREKSTPVRYVINGGISMLGWLRGVSV